MEKKDATDRKNKGMIHAFLTLLIACVLTLGTTPLAIATNPTTLPEYYLTLYPTIDTTIDQTTPEKNYNNTTSLKVSNTFGNNSTGWQRDILLYFDLSLLPTYTQIHQATLYLYYYDYDETDPAGRMLSLHRITDAWDMNNVTWKTRPTATQQNSSTATVPQCTGWMSWIVTSDVQQIIQSPSAYRGWQLSDKNPWREINIPVIKFKSTETQTRYQPYLDLDYRIPLMISTTGPYTAYITENISFNSSVIDGGTPPYTWHWDFGDDTASSDQNTTHAYTATGTYTISLTVSDTYGETKTVHTSAVIKENTTEPSISIQHPQNGLYFGNKKIVSLQKPWIIGPIEVTVYTETTYPIKKVKFLLDNQIQSIDTTAPYSWTWNQRTIPGKHTIKVIIIDDTDASAVDSLIVWKIF